MTQQRLRLGVLDAAEETYQQVLRQLERWASGAGKGDVAEAIGMAFSTFSNALRDRNRSRFDALQLVAMLKLDESGSVIGKLCDALGYDPPRRRTPFTAEQKVERAKAALHRLGAVGEELIQEIGL